MPECEGVEKASKDVEHHFTLCDNQSSYSFMFDYRSIVTYKDVLWGPPVSHECALGDSGYLNVERHCVLAMVVSLPVASSILTRRDDTL